MLELVRSNPLALNSKPPQLPTLKYIGGVVTEPALVAFAIPSVMVGLGAAGLFGGSLALGCVIIIVIAMTRFAHVRRYLERSAIDRARQRGESRRRARIRETNPMRAAQYLELRELVDEVERANPAAVARYELVDLLDHFVATAGSLEGYSKTLRLVGDDAFPSGRTGERSRTIADRRRSAAAAARGRIAALADELDAIEELVKLIVLEVAAPAPIADQFVAERLAELDDVSQGMRQLDAMCADR